MGFLVSYHSSHEIHVSLVEIVGVSFEETTLTLRSSGLM